MGFCACRPWSASDPRIVTRANLARFSISGHASQAAPQFPMVSQSIAALHCAAQRRRPASRRRETGRFALPMHPLKSHCSVDREIPEMSAHRFPLATATQLCMIGLLWSGIASADPIDGTSPGAPSQHAQAARRLPPQGQDSVAAAESTVSDPETNVAAAQNHRPDLGAAAPTGNASPEGAAAAVGGSMSRLAGLAFADASGAPPAAGAAGQHGGGDKEEAPAVAKVLPGKPTGERRAPFWNAQRGLGVAAAALALVGFGISGWYAAQNGQPTGSKECSLGELPNQPCRYDTTDQFAFGFVASNLGLALGIALFSTAHLP